MHLMKPGRTQGHKEIFLLCVIVHISNFGICRGKIAIYCPQGSGTLRQQLTILNILHILHILHYLA